MAAGLPAFSFRGRQRDGGGPLVISTWNFGLEANEAAWKILEAGGSALDAVEAGVRVPEADPNISSVGYGGLPDRDGIVTLDASIMDHLGNAGSVACIEKIMHPVSVARAVMEKTPHVMLVGEGALKFALDNGFKAEDLLTEKSKAAWEDWIKTKQYKPVNWENNHDTIGMLAINRDGNISGACSTSGLAFKMHGRVGDSPIIGAGLFVDNEIGAATSTGNGEYVMKTAGSHTVVELMRQGMSPIAACKEAVMRVVHAYPEKLHEIQVAYLALNKKGEYAGYALRKGFSYAHYDANGYALSDTEFVME